MRSVTFIAALSTILSLSAQDMQQYYYPVSDLDEPMTYVYKTECCDEIAYYLHVYTVVAGDETFLITESYSPEFEKQDYRKEKITESGAELVSYVLYRNGEEVRADVLEEDLMPWDLNENNHFSWKVSYELNDEEVVLWKTGNHYNQDIVMTDHDGKSYEGVQIVEYFIISNAAAERTIIFWNIAEYYEGLGVMSVERYEQGGVQVYAHMVDDILTEMEWKELNGSK